MVAATGTGSSGGIVSARALSPAEFSGCTPVSQVHIQDGEVLGGESVVRGEGTAEDPCTVRDVCVLLQKGDVGIRIQDTRAPVIGPGARGRLQARGERVHQRHRRASQREHPHRGSRVQEVPSTGARIAQSTNVTVQDTRFEANGYYGTIVGANSLRQFPDHRFLHQPVGRSLLDPTDARISNSTIQEVDAGIIAVRVQGPVVLDNQIREAAVVGVDLAAPNRVRLAHNRIEEGGIGFEVKFPHETTFSANDVVGQARSGVRAFFEGVLDMRANNLEANGLGLDVDSDAGCLGPTDVDARDNWWGCPGGPGAEACDAVDGPARIEP
jgi:hypothetical protein